MLAPGYNYLMIGEAMVSPRSVPDMRRLDVYKTILFLPALLLAVPIMSVNAADDESLRKAAITWLKEKTTEKQADESLIKALSKPIGDITKAGHNFTFLLGSEMTRSGKPVMVCGWDGELFPFTLTEGQAKKLDLKSTGIRFNANRRVGKPADQPIVFLSDFNIPDAASLDGGKPIKGTVVIRMFDNLKYADNLRFRLDLKFPEFTLTRYFTPKTVPEDRAVIELSFSEINSPGAKGKPDHGPVAVFLNMVEGPRYDEKKLRVLSNTLGVLIDVE